jgi:hypothetical protein
MVPNLVFGILCLLWPFLAVMSIFALDAPARSDLDAFVRGAFVQLAWYFPLFYVCGLVLSTVVYRRGGSAMSVLLVALLPLLNPLPWIPVLLIVLGIFGR